MTKERTLMKRSIILISLLTLAACAEGMQIPGVTMSAENRFLMAVENNGCILNQANTATVLEEADVSPEEVTEIVTDLTRQGKVETIMGASLRITTDRCA